MSYRNPIWSAGRKLVAIRRDAGAGIPPPPGELVPSLHGVYYAAARRILAKHPDLAEHPEQLQSAAVAEAVAGFNRMVSHEK